MPVSTDDPLDALLRPPPDESPEERLLRLEKEAEAKRISLAIDASIKAEKVARRKKRIVRLLLLGQSESGKYRGFFSGYEHIFDSISEFTGKSTTLRREFIAFPLEDAER
jgi:hypothetical protein